MSSFGFSQDDMVGLQCTATGERVCLAAEGFGNRHCYLENIADKVLIIVIFNLWLCFYILDCT